MKETIISTFDQRGLDSLLGICMRSDNGTQFISNTVEHLLSTLKIPHERIPPTTLK
jgi:transposase InsO family protein